MKMYLFPFSTKDRDASFKLSAYLGSDCLWGLFLIAAVFVAYLPVWWAGFVWDDSVHVTANPCIVGPLGLKQIWTGGGALQSFPLVISTFWFEHALWGLAPLPYHLVNVLQHAACAVVLWRVLRSLVIPGAWLGAALWALHPVQVESVAWISEMKNTESCLFYLLTIFFYVKYLRIRDNLKGSHGNYAATLLFAALAMASKPSTAVLPAVLALCAWWVEGQWHWRNLMRLAPIVLVSFVASAITMWPQAPDAGNALSGAGDWQERLALSGDVVWFYLGKLLWPHPLITIYPRWQIDPIQVVSYLPLAAVMLAGIILFRNRNSWVRPFFFASAYFLVVLSPFLGLIDQSFWRYSFVEDHLQYLACMGPLALAGAGIARFSSFALSERPWLRSASCAAVLLVLGLLSWQRARAFESEETLWTDTLAKNPHCWLAYNNLGNALSQKGQQDEAIALLQTALKINANYDLAHNNLGNAFFKKKQLDEAIAQYRQALALNPWLVEARGNLADALDRKGRRDEAIAEYEKALDINPHDIEAHNNLGMALYQKGEMDNAMAQFRAVLLIDPTYAKAYNNLGFVLYQTGKLDEAIEQYQNALKLAPNYTNALNDLGVALLKKGEVAEAIVQFRKVLSLNPYDSTALDYLNKAEAGRDKNPR